jgi:hypothetical protein
LVQDIKLSYRVLTVFNSSELDVAYIVVATLVAPNGLFYIDLLGNGNINLLLLFAVKHGLQITVRASFRPEPV